MSLANSAEQQHTIRSYQFIKNYVDNSNLSTQDFLVFNQQIREYLFVQRDGGHIYQNLKGFSRRLEDGSFLIVSKFPARFGPKSAAIIIDDESLDNWRQAAAPSIEWKWRPVYLPRYSIEQISRPVPYTSDNHADLVWNNQKNGLQETYCVHSFSDSTQYGCAKYLYSFDYSYTYLKEMHGKPFSFESGLEKHWKLLWKDGHWTNEPGHKISNPVD